MSQDSQSLGQQQGASPAASQLSDSDAATYSRSRLSPGPRRMVRAASGAELEADSGTHTPPPPALLRTKSHGYTSDQSGGWLAGWRLWGHG